MSEVERPRSGLSVASSVGTISSVTLGSKPIRSVKKVHTFGKRENALRRDLNSPVVVRGWLYKQDSAGLRLWKRRWFVLSEFCLFYYRDSREETVLGSILLPSYEILPASSKEAKNRKYTFKAEHPGMRTYHFSADTQEDMNSWIRAMNQSALAVADNNNKLSFTRPGKAGDLQLLACPQLGALHASYEDFLPCSLPPSTGYARSAESLEIAHLSESRSLGEDGSSGTPGQGLSPSAPRDAVAPPPTPVSGSGGADASLESGSSYHQRTAAGQLSLRLDCPHDGYPSPPAPRPVNPLQALSPSCVYSLEGAEKRLERSPAACPSSPCSRRATLRRYQRNYPEPPASPPTDRTGLVRPSRSYSLPTTPSDLSRPQAPTGSAATSPPPARSEVARAAARTAASSMPRLHQKARGSLGRCQAASCEELSLIDSPTLGGRRLARPHTPVGRVDILPDSELALSPSNLLRAHGKERPADGSRHRGQPGRPYPRPQTPSDRYDVLPSDDPYLSLARPTGHLGRFSKRSPVLGVAEQERLAGVDGASLPHWAHRAANNRLQVSHHLPSPSLSQLPPLPPVSSRPTSNLTPGKRLSLAALAAGSGSYKDRMLQLGRRTESEMDALLTRLCGQDKLLLSLEGDWSQLQVEKETLENTLDLTRLRLEELQDQEPTEKVRRQQRLLQDDLVRVRARLCDLAPEMEGAWQEYRVLENELHDQRYALEHLHRTGHPQEQAAAQRDLWMIDDIVSGLRANKNNFPGVHEFARHPPIFFPASPAHEEPFVYQRGFVHLSELELPGPKKKPRGLAEAHSTDEPTVVALEAGGVHFLEHSWALSTGGDSPNTSSQGSASVCVQRETCSPVSSAVSPQGEGDPEAKASPPARGRRQRMSAEEQLERMRRHREAQIPERPKPPRRRALPPRSPAGDSQSTVTTPQLAGCNGAQPEQLTTGSPDAQKPALVTVTASYLPFAVAAAGKPQARSEGAELADVPKDSPSPCRCREGTAAAPLVGMGGNARAAPSAAGDGSEVAAGLCRAGKPTAELRLNQYHVSSFRCTDSLNLPLSPGRLEARRRPVDRMTTTVRRSSPGLFAGSPGSQSEEGYCTTPEGERERIISLSYTLAAEASQLSKLMTAKALANDSSMENDSWTPEGTELWRPSQQDELPQVLQDTSAHPSLHSRATAHPMEAEEPADRLAVQYTISSAQDQHLDTANGLSDVEGPMGIASVWDGSYCKQWTVEEGSGSREAVAGGELDQVAKWVLECNGKGVYNGPQWQGTDLAQMRIDKVLGYLKEVREQPVRVTLLQSSF